MVVVSVLGIVTDRRYYPIKVKLFLNKKGISGKMILLERFLMVGANAE